MKQQKRIFKVENPQDNYSHIDGLWEVKETPKSIVLNWIEDGSVFEPEFKNIVCRKDNQCKHCIKIWDDDSFTVYLFRNGTPIYFIINN